METILATKLHMPAPRADIVPLVSLLNRLDAELAAGSRLTLVSASAGYGKTTLARIFRSPTLLHLDTAV